VIFRSLAGIDCLFNSISKNSSITPGRFCSQLLANQLLAGVFSLLQQAHGGYYFINIRLSNNLMRVKKAEGYNAHPDRFSHQTYR